MTPPSRHPSCPPRRAFLQSSGTTTVAGPEEPPQLPHRTTRFRTAQPLPRGAPVGKPCATSCACWAPLGADGRFPLSDSLRTAPSAALVVSMASVVLPLLVLPARRPAGPR